MGDRYDQTMISKAENGRTGFVLDGMAAASRVLGVSTDWLLGVTDIAAPSMGVEFIPIDTEPAFAGFDRESTVLPADGPYPFRRERLSEGEGIDPAQARVYQVDGNSMYPVLPDGSTILVDYQRTMLMENCIFIYRTNGAMFIKRSKKCMDEWWWCSDNPMGGNVLVKKTDTVIGEVRWVGHTLNYGISYGP